MGFASRCSRLESHCNGKRQRQATSFLRDFFHGAGRHGGRLGWNLAGAADAKASTASRVLREKEEKSSQFRGVTIDEGDHQRDSARLLEDAEELCDAEEDDNRTQQHHHATELATPYRHLLGVFRVAGQYALGQQESVNAAENRNQ